MDSAGSPQLGWWIGLAHNIRCWLGQDEAARRWRKLLRLGLFQFGMGVSLAPITGTFNRVLIDDLCIPAVLICFQSDQQRAARHWRTPYIMFGAMLTYSGLACAPFALILLGGNGHLAFCPAPIICLLIFLAYGIGVNIVETSYLMLVSDLTPPQECGRVLAILWALLWCLAPWQFDPGWSAFAAL